MDGGQLRRTDQEGCLLHVVQRRQLDRQHHHALHLRLQIRSPIRKSLIKQKHWQHPRAQTNTTQRNALKGILVIWCILWGVVIAQVFLLSWMQKQKGNQREAAGLPRDFIDHSMDDKFEEAGAEVHGENGLADMTDKENLYFRYLL